MVEALRQVESEQAGLGACDVGGGREVGEELAAKGEGAGPEDWETRTFERIRKWRLFHVFAEGRVLIVLLERRLGLQSRLLRISS